MFILFYFASTRNMSKRRHIQGIDAIFVGVEFELGRLQAIEDQRHYVNITNTPQARNNDWHPPFLCSPTR